MRDFSKRITALESQVPSAPRKVVIIDEGETPPADADFVIELVAQPTDANGRAVEDVA